MTKSIIETISLTEFDQDLFKKWLRLDIHSVTWGGEHLAEFEKLWQNLFSPECLLKDQVHKLKYAKLLIPKGPLHSWFNWLEKKNLFFVLLLKEINIGYVLDLFDFTLAEFFIDLRYFVEEFGLCPLENFSTINSFCLHDKLILTKKLSDLFSFDDAIYNKFVSIRNNPEDLEKFFPVKNYLMQTFEVTIYKEFRLLKNKFENKKLINHHLSYDSTETNKASTAFKSVVKDVTLLSVIFVTILGFVKYSTIWYEQFLANKISLFEPTFFWLDKESPYKDENSLSINDLDLAFSDLDRVERDDLELRDSEEISKALFQEESDVVLTSLDDVPRSFGSAKDELSQYEEAVQGGLRGSGHGKGKAYRVLINSSNTVDLSKKMNYFIKKFNLEQLDNVKPGTPIPGGLYYNVLVKNDFLRDFLEEINSLNDVTILESQVNLNQYPNMNKIFIWVKKI